MTMRDFKRILPPNFALKAEPGLAWDVGTYVEIGLFSLRNLLFWELAAVPV